MRMKFEPLEEQNEGDIAVGNIDPFIGGDNDGNASRRRIGCSHTNDTLREVQG